MTGPSIDFITALPSLPRRALDSHKGTFGKVAVVAGSRGMSGAAVLVGSAALRAGAGLVRVAVPSDIQSVVAAGNPCYTTIGLPCDAAGRLLPEPEWVAALEADNDVLAVGPGLGRSTALKQVVRRLLQTSQRPLVLDADGLTNIADEPALLARRSAPTILTPHPGEFAQLLRTDTATVQGQRQTLAVEFARQHGVVVLLKGHRTLVTDGRRLYENRTGNPGMATGGSGDVLTGIIAALVGQGLEAFVAAQLGAYVHGLAGDLARRDVGEVGLIASDLLTWLPRAFLHL